MTTSPFIRRLVISLSFVLIVGLSSFVARAADSPVSGAQPAMSAAGQMAPSAGAVEDTLKACLARIPKDASTGQSLLAERGCQRDQLERTSLQAAPKF
jgi:hypothetical protein